VWIAGEVLTASDLNAEFNNIITQALSLISPLTSDLNFNGNKATNLRFETQTATQSAAAEGVVYFQTTEDSLHISNGTAQLRVPALLAIQAGELVGMTNPSGVDGATVYSRIQLGTGLTLTGTVLNGSVSSGGGNPISAAVFN
jgi:hypothetical protein